MSSHKIVALVSGGKDSLFSLLHCLEHGHDIVALANLHPPSKEGTVVDDMDSFMYQTVGHDLIPLIAQALELPLYREAIAGSAVDTAKTYRTASGDETEDLTRLLQRVMNEHPDISAVSTGAIFSDYQRTRVESVALRLGLTPISYLWQYPRVVTNSTTSLLEAMTEVGQDARIIKVSSGGLDENFLWQNVASPQTMARLRKASARFGTMDDGAVLGEGGEYETLAVDGPFPLWKHSLTVEDVQVVSGDAGSSYITCLRPTLRRKSSTQSCELPLPSLFDDHFAALLDDQKINPKASAEKSHITAMQDQKHAGGGLIFLNSTTDDGRDANEQTTNVMSEIKDKLEKSGHQLTDIVYVCIVLRQMGDFVAVNQAYGRWFTEPNPPARMTVARADLLPAGKLVSISITSIKSTPTVPRTALHVQSISYWAPANIGPYSQAVTAKVTSSLPDNESDVVYLSGQIPLQPATMRLLDVPNATPETEFIHQAVLSLQHMHRVAMATSVRRWIHCVGFVVGNTNDSVSERVELLQRIWQRAYGTGTSIKEDGDSEDDADNFDVWNVRRGLDQSLAASTGDANSYSANEAKLFAAIPPQLHVCRVDALPRSAQVEWIAFGTTVEHDHPSAIPQYHHLLSTFGSLCQ